MDIPKSFKPEILREQKFYKKDRVRSISDLVLENRMPEDYFLFTKEKNRDIAKSYEYMLPVNGLKFNLGLVYKPSIPNNNSPYFRVDILEFESASFVSKNLEKFYKAKKKLNGRVLLPILNDILIKERYVIFFRGFNQDILEKFTQLYRTRFDMKKIEAKYDLK